MYLCYNYQLLGDNKVKKLNIFLDDFIRKHMRVMQFVLVLLILPSFVFFGIQGYSRFGEGGNAVVATVAGQKITQAELEAAHREQVNRMRAQYPNIDAKIFDAPEMRQRTLDEMVRERVTLAAAHQLDLVTSDERLRRLFAADPQFAMLRNPDGSVNKQALAQQGMSSEMFAQRLAQDLSRRQVLLGVAGTVIAPLGASTAAMDALLQQREIQVVRFDAKDYQARVAPTEEQLQAYYDDSAHAAQFMAPEQAKTTLYGEPDEPPHATVDHAPQVPAMPQTGIWQTWRTLTAEAAALGIDALTMDPAADEGDVAKAAGRLRKQIDTARKAAAKA